MIGAITDEATTALLGHDQPLNVQNAVGGVFRVLKTPPRPGDLISQAYLTWMPEMALATTNRWISDVPSKMVKILRRGGTDLPTSPGMAA